MSIDFHFQTWKPSTYILEELSIPKSPFEIKWPLVTVKILKFRFQPLFNLKLRVFKYENLVNNKGQLISKRPLKKIIWPKPLSKGFDVTFRKKRLHRISL